MATPIEILDQLISQQPVALQPIFQQLSNMLKSSQTAFDGHLSDNENLFSQQNAVSRAIADRVSSLETRADSVSHDGSLLGKRVDDVEATAAALQSRADSVARDGNKAVEEVQVINAKISTIHAVVNTMSEQTYNMITEQKSAFDLLELRTSQAEAHAMVLDSKIDQVGKDVKSGSHRVDGDGVGRKSDKDWAGVAGSRLFTSRVKEYSGPISSFQNWSSNFKSNVPKDMRAAIDWAEKQTEPITNDEIMKVDLVEWDEEVWRCLAGVLKGQWETLKNTLKNGQGLELWRQLVAGHITRGPDHADSINQALHAVSPAKDLGEVRHKLNVIKAGIIKYDELATEPMQDGARRALYLKVLPKEVAKHLAMQAVGLASAEALVETVMKYITDMQGFEATMGLTSVSMELGAVVPGASDSQAQEIATLKAELKSLGALMGKGGTPPGLGKNGWNSGGKKGAAKGFGKNADGKGSKGGKAGGGKPSDARRGAKLCHEYQKTGKCWYLDNYGYCKFKHVRGLPGELSNVDGLRFEDLVGNLKYDRESQIYTYNGNADSKEIKASVEAELAAIAKEMDELEMVTGGEPEPGAGF